MPFSFLGALAVFGACLIIANSFSKAKQEEQVSEKIIGNFRPLMSDRRPNDGGRSLIPNILGQPVEGSV